MEFPDYQPSPNQLDVDVYEIENTAFDRHRVVLSAMRRIAPWKGLTIVDLGCGAGFWLPVYQSEASTTIGVEPDAKLFALATTRCPEATVVRGSAEVIPLADSSVDVVHARFVYFFPPGCDRGLGEVLRVLRPGGTLVVVDNDLERGEFGELVSRSVWARAQGQTEPTREWWTDRGATRTDVMSDWTFDSRSDMEKVLRMELPEDIANPWLVRHPQRTHITYGYALFSLTRPAAGDTSR